MRAGGDPDSWSKWCKARRKGCPGKAKASLKEVTPELSLGPGQKGWVGDSGQDNSMYQSTGAEEINEFRAQVVIGTGVWGQAGGIRTEGLVHHADPLGPVLRVLGRVGGSRMTGALERSLWAGRGGCNYEHEGSGES